MYKIDHPQDAYTTSPCPTSRITTPGNDAGQILSLMIIEPGQPLSSFSAKLLTFTTSPLCRKKVNDGSLAGSNQKRVDRGRKSDVSQTLD
jgi:hypothetical protein